MKLKQWTRFSAVTVTSAALLMAACVDESVMEPQAAEPPVSPLFSQNIFLQHGGQIFQESGGQVVVEAEHFSARVASVSDPPQEWLIVPTEAAGFPSQFANHRGDGYVQALPDVVGDFSHPPEGGVGKPPYVDYMLRLTTTGTYRLFARWDSHDGNSDSFYASIVELSDGPGGSVADWYRYSISGDKDFATVPWHGVAGFERTDAGGNNTAAVWVITEPGDYTLRIFEREDGAAIDAFILQLSSLSPPVGDGPPESEIAHGQLLVTICHKGRTITIAQTAVAAHLAHGDTEGACSEE